ncbi:flagellin [Aestuariivita sp.]|jgi:flagellar hook-associated protein 3 FlgL|uniref:flagellin n=1 Tax=Aestuariivita sp. TaxID=1872407 RepID=UPI00217491EC|nr:flagellin [Aestuariivita sp.]MCE8008990.1 flagellar hook protein [Aestuariivita sp.]
MSVSIGRLSTMQFMQLNRDFIARTTVEMQKAGNEASTGRKSDIYGDLGPAAAAALTLRTREADTQAYMVTNTLLEGKLQSQLDAVDSVREQVTGVLQNVLANASSPLAGAETLQMQARNALEITIAQLNVSFNGEALFGGTRTGAPPLTQYADVNPDTGLSPESVISGILTAPPGSIAEAEAMIAELDAVFASTATDTATNFEATFYNGTPALDANGDPSHRISGRIEPGLELEYGVQANDAPFRDILKGLAMLAAVDASEIADPDTYVAWMDQIAETLGNGSQAALNMSAEIGFRQQTVETAQKRLESLSMVQTTQISELESVDPYEAATRFATLDAQLRASYEITSQLTSLSLLNYL